MKKKQRLLITAVVMMLGTATISDLVVTSLTVASAAKYSSKQQVQSDVRFYNRILSDGNDDFAQEITGKYTGHIPNYKLGAKGFARSESGIGRSLVAAAKGMRGDVDRIDTSNRSTGQLMDTDTFIDLSSIGNLVYHHFVRRLGKRLSKRQFKSLVALRHRMNVDQKPVNQFEDGQARSTNPVIIKQWHNIQSFYHALGRGIQKLK